MISTSSLSVLDLLRRRIVDLSRQLAEQDSVLHERTRHLRVAQSLTHLGSWDWEIESGEVRCSSEVYRIFGREPGSHSMTFEIFVSALAPEDHDRVVAAINDALGGRTPFDVEYRILRPNGDVRTVHCCGEVLRDDAGRPCRMSGSVQDISERKGMELALQQREAYFRALIEHSSDLITVLDLDGTIRFQSPSVERLLGYAQTELNGHIALELVHPEDLQHVAEKIRQLSQLSEMPHIEEFRVRHKDGSWRYFEGIGRAFRDLDGQSGIIVNSRDMTERKRTEAMLRSSQQMLRQALQASGIGLWDWNTETNQMVLSGEWKWQLGYEETELSDAFETWEVLLHPDDHDRAIAYLQHYVRERQGEYRQEFRLRHNNGTYRWIEARASFITEPDGSRIRLLGSHTDITDRKRMEEAVRESEDRYRTLVELSPSGVFVFSEERIGYVNHTGAILMGANDPQEILGRPMFDFIHPDYRQEVRENVKRLLTGSVSVHSAERIYLKNDGTPVPVQVEAARIMWSGKPAILALVCDVTDRRQAEEALRASEERFAKAFRTSPHPVVISEIDTGRLVDVNDAAYQLLGYRKEEVEEHTALEIGVWSSVEERTRFVDLLKRAGSVRNVEVNLRSKNGDIRQFLLSSELIELNGKRCSVTVGDDITDRKRAEDELRRSHAFLRQVIDSDPNFIFAKDREGRFTLVNKAVADCYGTTVENLIGQSDADFNPNWEEVESFRQKELQVMNSLQECVLAEEKITDWSGKTRWLQTVKRPIVDDHGQVRMVLGVATDITERRQMEEMLRQRERDLSAALQERERISHDLHDGILQSLYVVGLGLESCKPLVRQQPEQVSEPFMTTLDQAIGQLNQVMGEVRNFIVGLESHLIQGGDFAAVLRTMVQAMCGASSATCRVRIDDAAGRYITTEQGLHIINIVREGLSNALRHSRATRMTLSLQQLIGSVRLTITDNGIGFNPRSAYGVGHGLENMTARAQKVGGLFAVRSEPGKGTRILLDLPKDSNTDVS